MIYDVSIPIAFGAGLVSFFAPCVLPLLPAYIGYVTGVSVHELKKNGHSRYRKKIFISSFMYILGFSLLFVAIGTAAAGISSYLRVYDKYIQQLGGLFILIMGLQFAGFIDISILDKERKLSLPDWADKLGYFRSFIVGVIFSVAWSPCVGAVYGAILSLAAISGTAARGAFLLFVYSLGISLPFLLVSMTLASASGYLKRINRHINTISKISGIILALIGFLLLTGTYKYVNAWVYDLGFNFSYRLN